MKPIRTRRLIVFSLAIRLTVRGNISSQSEGIARAIARIQNENPNITYDGKIFYGYENQFVEIIFTGRIRPRSWWHQWIPFTWWGRHHLKQLLRLKALLKTEYNVGRRRLTYHWTTEAWHD
jgi:hypothetical protein